MPLADEFKQMRNSDKVYIVHLKVGAIGEILKKLFERLKM